MSIINIIEIAAGVMLAKLVIGILNESYWYKWSRVRMELKRLQRGRKRQKKKVQVPCAGKERLETNFSL